MEPCIAKGEAQDLKSPETGGGPKGFLGFPGFLRFFWQLVFVDRVCWLFVFTCLVGAIFERLKSCVCYFQIWGI